MKFIHIAVKERNGRYKRVPGGPFPITPDQLEQARAAFQKELAVCPDLMGIKVSPQTAARDILKTYAPHLDNMDNCMLGFAVSAPAYRIIESDEP
jgi:hypothetical protein